VGVGREEVGEVMKGGRGRSGGMRVGAAREGEGKKGAG